MGRTKSENVSQYAKEGNVKKVQDKKREWKEKTMAGQKQYSISLFWDLGVKSIIVMVEGGGQLTSQRATDRVSALPYYRKEWIWHTKYSHCQHCRGHLTADSQLTLHSKEATKIQLINANLNYNNIQLYSVRSIRKVVEYSHNEECSSGTQTSRYQRLE